MHLHVICSYLYVSRVTAVSQLDFAPSLLRRVAIGTHGTRTRCTTHHTLRRGAAGLCARVRACAGAAESLHTYTLHTTHTMFTCCVLVRYLYVSCGCVSADSAPFLLWLVSQSAHAAHGHTALHTTHYTHNVHVLCTCTLFVRLVRLCLSRLRTLPPPACRNRHTRHTDTLHYTLHTTAWRRGPVCACTRVCGCCRIFTYIHTTHYTYNVNVPFLCMFTLFVRLLQLCLSRLRTLPPLDCRSHHTRHTDTLHYTLHTLHTQCSRCVLVRHLYVSCWPVHDIVITNMV